MGFVLAGLTLWALRLFEVGGLAPVVIGQALFTLCYGFLLRAFATTLRAGQEPLITNIARRVRGTVLPPDINRYTRNVTLLWVAVFAAQLVLSVALLLLAPLAWWAAFVTWISPLSVVLVFALEFVVRRILLRHHPRDRLRDLAKVLRMTLAEAGK
ncbi:hypothetical protein TMPK1_04310 [Rhodospirillales bacterium TMPK1]|uniref:Uncharacterized protein n=1 Tax=Roseiterribacter gracilis TaxID=2812848 RepID=A0A8S8X796_9PROT|nr:hypothetical protein TMPK1_04310 [Rhodospirillales bacterium TMPK1]